MPSEIITRLDEYNGEPTVVLMATQLGLEYSTTQAKRVVSEWVEFLSAGPSPIQELRFVSRTPKRLFEALRAQTQLKALDVKWGDYADLTALEGMRDLHTLRLAGASSVETLAPLARLQRVQSLSLESLRRVHDLSPIGEMHAVTSLDVGGNWMSHRIARVASISFLRRMPQLQELLLHTLIADDLDYSPILGLPALTHFRVMKARGMRPSHEQLKASPAWSEGDDWW